MRKHKIVTVGAEGRDKGKGFLIVEKSAMDTEKWATRALLALSRNGVEVPEDAIQAGALGVVMAGMGALQNLPYEDAEPLLDEMLACISFVIDATRLDPITSRPASRPILHGEDGDIEEVTTLLLLRKEVLELHLGFSVTAALLNIVAAVQNSRQQAT